MQWGYASVNGVYLRESATLPSAIATELAGDCVSTSGVTVFIALEPAIWVIDGDFRLIENVDDGSNGRSSSTTV